MRLVYYGPNISMGRIFINTENSKTSKQRKFVLNLSQRLDLRISNKHVAFQNLLTCYTRKNKRQQCKNNKLRIIAPTWNDEFELPDGSYSVSDIQDYIEIKHSLLILLVIFPSIAIIIDSCSKKRWI